ncbi:hypothetical protein FHT40_006711 [Mycolicibacterium sp. BK556]|nr:hypothetical protein [Mycolicibacterium sp. BK556]MBB3636773.1 hypothetical protein [Mycolicibacterium sp. BK607]MBB3747574.1 hypothetical protein [Mycolicibacterium sp. BK634]TDO08288.1 hypothetical protein EV580_5863 [Mycobacterium sp. BK086]
MSEELPNAAALVRRMLTGADARYDQPTMAILGTD